MEIQDITEIKGQKSERDNINGPDEPKRESTKSNNIIYGSSLQNTAEPKETWKEEGTNEIPKE